jgi:hypothetical protein
MAVDLFILIDILFQFGLGNGWLLLVDDVDEEPLLVLPGSIFFDVLVSPLDVATVFLFELTSYFTEEDRNSFLLLLFSDFHGLPLLNVSDEFANTVLC